MIIAFHPVPYLETTFEFSCINIVDRRQFVDVTFKWSSILLALMFLRLIFFVRTIFNYSEYTSEFSKKLCFDNFGFQPNVRFTFKALILKRPGLTVLTSLSISIFTLAYILRIFEIVYYRAVGMVDMD